MNEEIEKIIKEYLSNNLTIQINIEEENLQFEDTKRVNIKVSVSLGDSIISSSEDYINIETKN